MFRLLGLPPGPDISVAAAASLAGASVAVTRTLLTALARAHMVDEHLPGRYRLHDLLHAYAYHCAVDEIDEAERTTAMRRLLDYYLRTGFHADKCLYPYRFPIDLPTPESGIIAPTMTTARQATDWFTAELGAMLAIVTYAAGHGFEDYAWRLPWTLATYFHRQGHWHEYLASQHLALDVANRLGDRAAQARVHRNIGRPYTLLEQSAEAFEHFEVSLRMCAELADHTGQALCLDALTWLCGRLERYADAADYAERALVHHRAVESTAGEARSLNYIGANRGRLGEYAAALDYCARALRLFRDIDNSVGEADTLDSIGYAHNGLGDHDAAIDNYRASIALWQELGDRYNEADLLLRLGDIYLSTDERGSAEQSWRAALAILTELDHPKMEIARSRLAGLGPAAENAAE
jgi:tetratricopeptide (TPR) repeat protein